MKGIQLPLLPSVGSPCLRPVQEHAEYTGCVDARLRTDSEVLVLPDTAQ